MISFRSLSAPIPLRHGLAQALLIFAALFLLAPTLSAAEPTASAAFLPSSTAMGDPVQLRIEIKGSSQAGQMPPIQVDGLDVRYLGPSSQEFVNFDGGGITRTSSVIHIYQVTPRRTGIFTLPSLAIQAEGRTIHTEPVVLNVQGAGASEDGGIDPAGHMEIAVAKKSAYVGEPIPVDIRLYVDTRIHWQLETIPDLEGDGFTKEKLQKPKGDKTRRDGREYDVAIFHTSVTPSRAGSVTLGPAEIRYLAQVPRARRPRNMFGFNPLEEFFDDPGFGMGRTQEKSAEATPVTIEVKPLPAAGKPVGFSGAVGQYQISLDANPKQVKISDPVTVKISVTGRGSLDRVGAPTLPEADGWHSYPPSSRTMADDETGMKGTKIFEQALIPTAKQTHIPIYEFAYFDPKLEKYVTLKTDPLPIKVEGEPPATPPPVAKATPASSSAPTAAAPAPLPAPTDINGIRYEFGDAQSIEPLYLRLGFLAGQLVPALGLGAMVLSRFWRPSQASQRNASLRRKRASLLGELRRQSTRSAFYAAAVRVCQIDGALATGRAPETIDIAAIRPLVSPDQAHALEVAFDFQAAALYAGAESADEPVPPADREGILAALAALEKSKAAA